MPDPPWSSPGTSLTLDWTCFDFVVDPADVVGDTRVHPGLVPLPTAVAPAHHTQQRHPVFAPADERTPGVSLWMRGRRFKVVGAVVRKSSVKVRLSHLAGVVQASGVTCTQHVGGNWASGQHVWDAALIGPEANISPLDALGVFCRN